MIFRFINRLAILFAVLLPAMLSGQVPDITVVKNHCAEPEEVALYNLINDYRKINQLPAIPFSRSLSYVARVHAMDLTNNRPDFGGCNPHSWSAKGVWKPCCYARDKNRILCMNEKPREIAGYKFKGWEMVYSGGEEAKAADAFDLWKGMGLTNDYLLNTGKWLKPWKAIGIGFYGEYACVWFGEGEDTEKGFGLCQADSAGIQANDQSPPASDENQAAIPVKYYIITGSLNNQEKAYQEVQRLRDLGYNKARVLASEENFRISVCDYNSEREAVVALPDFQKLFPNAWLLRLAE